jgi:small ligand-binding sensory domain FIST
VRFASHLSTATELDDLVAELIEFGQAFDDDISVAFLFASQSHAKFLDAAGLAVRESLGPGILVGCSAESVLTTRLEVEDEPAVTLVLASMPGVTIDPVRVAGDDWTGLISTHHAMLDALSLGPKSRGLIALFDPWTVPLDQVLNVVSDHRPGVPVLGGVASGARAPGQNQFLLNDELFHDGLVGLSFSGNVTIDPIVSQGCRPLWKPLIVTRARGNAIGELGGKPALATLRGLIESMNDAEKKQLGHGLMLGRAVSEYRDAFGPGDFVMRGILGVEEESQMIGITDRIRVGQTIQFHVRDAQTAHDDLVDHLQKSIAARGAAAGGVLFTCNGRGSRMFDTASHDATTIASVIPDMPLGGFFAAGEVGPVDGRHFVHGHTACLALFRPEA